MHAQKTAPYIFRVQDKQAKKHTHKYLQYDTLITTSQAVIHVSYNISNNKPYLLLLHGMGANGRSNWYNQIASLSKHFNVIMPDLIYFGESFSNSKNFSVEFQAKQLYEAIEKLGIKQKINVMGFSYGGLTTAVYNQLYNTQINKLIIIDAPVKFYSGELADSLAKQVGVSNINRVIVPETINDFNGMKKAVMSSNFPLSKNMKRKIIKYYFDAHREVRYAQMNYLIEFQEKYQSYNYNLDKTKTLLIWGSKDGVIPPIVGQKLNQQFSSTTQLIIFPKAKHDVHFSDTKKLNQSVIDFLKE
jgi:pimeloyl-ACP methyl ester carboxylesterase